jgi:uncharacterized protein (DUF1697 family)
VVARRPNKYVALLRGINVGGKNKLPMKELAALFDVAGCKDVETYIQSGNVVFAASSSLAKSLPTRMATAIKDAFGYDVPVVLRSAAELRRVVKANPFLKPNPDHKKLQVAFLAKKPKAKQIAGLDPNRSPGDEFQVQGREIFVHCPNGLGKSKLTNQYFDRQLETVSTIRNWRTVLALLERTS